MTAPRLVPRTFADVAVGKTIEVVTDADAAKLEAVVEAAVKMRHEADCNEPYARLAAEAFDAARAEVGK